MSARGGPHPYDELTPDVVLGAAESIGYATDGRLLALNSFENRVYQIGLEDRSFVIAKFYRPGRWSDAQIREEHTFTAELAEAEIAVVGPLSRDGESLFEHEGFRFALFPRRGGRAPELEGLEVSAWMGRMLARMHAIGARAPFRYRPALTLESHVDAPASDVLESGLLPEPLESRYERAISHAREGIAAAWEAVGARTLRLHGDSHPGNVLWTEAGPTLVDFDDARAGPAAQDLWMLLTGGEAQREALLEGYEQFRTFDRGELALIEPLRLMRQIHYAGWIAARYDDPAFPRAFPFAAEPRWWEQHLADLVEGAEALARG
ncbi:MAG TPA: serine/threonine protein kinase [Candidatus Saccharimonadia bacterium]|nr:serine/threonine protein kinase [Candidatus Saccharimonadia bacterium]